MKSKFSFLPYGLITVLFFMFFSCKDEFIGQKDDKFIVQSSGKFPSELSENSTDKRTIDRFKYLLTKGLSYEELIILFGSPNADVGSGFHIYEYKLADGTFVWIGFTDCLIYGVHLDAEHKVISEFLK